MVYLDGSIEVIICKESCCNNFENLKKNEHKDSFSWQSRAFFHRQKGNTSPRVVVSLALLDFSLPKSLVDCLVDESQQQDLGLADPPRLFFSNTYWSPVGLAEN